MLLVRVDWFKFFYIANSINNSYIGLNNTQAKKNYLKNVEFFFGVGLDNPKNF